MYNVISITKLFIKIKKVSIALKVRKFYNKKNYSF